MKIQVFVSVANFNFDPEADKDLLTLAAYARMARAAEKDFEIISMQADPLSFLQEPAVAEQMAELDDRAFPLTLVDGDAIIIGRYPTKEELEEILDIEFLPVNCKREAVMQKGLSALKRAQAGPACGGCSTTCSACPGCGN